MGQASLAMIECSERIHQHILDDCLSVVERKSNWIVRTIVETFSMFAVLNLWSFRSFEPDLNRHPLA